MGLTSKDVRGHDKWSREIRNVTSVNLAEPGNYVDLIEIHNT